MNMKKHSKGSLGRGLSAILGTKSNKKEYTQDNSLARIHEISINEIQTNPFQPRINFKQEKLDELALSIKELGVIQPITVREIDINKYQLISGERRYKASQLAGLNKIPAFIRKANDQEMLEMALVENIQREDLNPIEIALSYKRLINECKLTQEACSNRVGKKRTTITNFLRLLKLPTEIQEGLAKGEITSGHARALININSIENQMNVYKDIIHNGYSVREVEQIAKIFKNSVYKRLSRNKKTITPHPFSHQKMLNNLSAKINTDVDMKRNKKGKGKIIIPFKTDEDFISILDIINK